MTREQWLNTVLSGLAPRVRERLRAEYQAHMLDMHEDGQADWAIQAAFGDPVKLNKELKERYLTEYEDKVLAARSRLWTRRTPWLPLIMGLVGVTVLLALNLLFGGRPWALWWLPLVVGGLGTGWLLYLRRSLPALQLALRGSSAFSFVTLLMFWSLQSRNWLDGWHSGAALLGLIVVLFVWFEFGLNGPLHRKLSAEERGSV